MFFMIEYVCIANAGVDTEEMSRAVVACTQEPSPMCTKQVVLTSTGLVIPWGSKLLDAIDGALDAKGQRPHRCHKCGLMAGYSLMTADGCVDCVKAAKKAAKAIQQRLRSYRAA